MRCKVLVQAVRDYFNAPLRDNVAPVCSLLSAIYSTIPQANSIFPLFKIWQRVRWLCSRIRSQ